MAERRMFSKKIIASAKFIKMPMETQNLYFHLGLNADDDGVVEAFSIMRLIGATEDSLKILAAKGFIHVLNEDLVTFIVDWQEHNKLRSDRKINSIYKELLIKMLPDVKLLKPTERADRKEKNKTGTSHGRTMDSQWTDNGQSMDGLGEDRLGEDRLGEDRLGEDSDTENGKNENDSLSEEEKKAAAALSEKIISFFNKHCTNFKSISGLDNNTINLLNSWYCETKSFDKIKKCFEMAQKSSFLKGKPWATFHWIISDKNRNKIIDGNYMDGDMSTEDKRQKFLEDYRKQKEAGLL